MYFPIIVIGAVIVGVIFKFNEHIDAYLINKLNNQDKIYRIVVAFILAVLYYLSDQPLWNIALIGVLGYLLPAFAGAGAVAVILALQGNYTYSLLVAVFYFAFPLINALLDWFSWYISRLFLQRANQETHFGKIALDIFYDLIFALLFMLMLCLLLPAGAELLNQIYALFSDARIDWQSMVLEAKQDPWGKGIMITLMLVTTLIPTAIHVFLGSFAVFINGAPGKKLATYLKQANHNASNRIPLVATFWMMSYASIVLLAITGIIWLILTIANLPIANTLYGVTAYMYNL